MNECEKCGLIIGLGCACSLSPPPPSRPYQGYYRWTKFEPDVLLISSKNMAHIPGACSHHTEDDVLNPANGWGWISNPAPDLWRRITPDNPVPATHGNTSRAATSRCSDCLDNVPG
jgi:hypothetical protein